MEQKKTKISFKKIITYVIYVLVVLFAIAALTSRFSPRGFHLLTVQSGSMEPAIKVGSLVIVKSQSEYNVGDIITFYSAAGTKDTTTHRIIDNFPDETGDNFQTQGDANGTPDGNLVPESRVVGQVIGKVPYAGYPVAFARTLPGLIILIVIPATIIIYDEVGNIRKEWRKRKKGKNNQKPIPKKGQGAQNENS